MDVLVTGTAGFIGYHVAERLLAAGRSVVGIDNLTPYYDVTLKTARLERLTRTPGFVEARIDLQDRAAVMDVFATHRPRRVVHLAAQAGVRHSLEAPHSYIDSNIVGFLNILEGCRGFPVENLLFASSSSVYGANARLPLSEHQGTSHPLSLYAATKRANELMAHSYGHLFGIPTVGLRFFTVYGPWGRPDMALFKFTKGILEDQPIDVFNYGRMRRDFTYIDDIVSGILALLDIPPVADPRWNAEDPDPATSGVAPFRLYNIGNSAPVELMTYIEILEKALGRKAKLNMLPMQGGDVQATWADVDDLARDAGYHPSTSVEDGVNAFVGWYKHYYGIN